MRPGFFKLRLVKNGPYLPALIERPCPIEMFTDQAWNWLDRWPRLVGWYDVDALGNVEVRCDPYKIWLGGTELEKGDFMFYCELRQYIKLHESDAPDANRNAAIDLSKMAPVGPRER